MSIKALALDLYRAQQKVDTLKRAIDEASYKDQEGLKSELKMAQKEWQILRNMLDGEKESGSFRKKFSRF